MNFPHQLMLVLICAATLFGCRTVSEVEETNQSRVHFIGLFSPRSISLRYARAPIFRICARGDTNERVEGYAVKAVLTWFSAVRMIDDKVTKDVRISCQQPHLTINMRAGRSVSFAGPGNAVYYTGQPYGELLHELGHAVMGLGDTYQGRQAGACRPNQPQSNMCWGAYGPRTDLSRYSGLWPDDIKGAQAQHRKIFDDLQAPTNVASIDPEKPLNVETVWNDTQPKVYVALGLERGSDASLYLAFEGKAQTFVGCFEEDELENCIGNPRKVQFAPAPQITGPNRYVSSAALTLESNTPFYIYAVSRNGELVGSSKLRFQPKN